MAHWWNLSPVDALAKGVKLFGSNVLVESGPTIIEELIANRILDGIYLSVTTVTSGENRIDTEKLLANFQEISRNENDGTIFIEAKTLK